MHSSASFHIILQVSGWICSQDPISLVSNFSSNPSRQSLSQVLENALKSGGYSEDEGKRQQE